MRVILDRSIFHGSNFNIIKQSRLASLVAKGTIKIYYTTAFIEETLMFVSKNPEHFLEQWHYIVSLNKSFWFCTPTRILSIELGRKAHRHNYYFLKPQEIQNVILNALRLVKKSVPREEMQKALGQIQRNYDIRTDLRSHRIRLRQTNPQIPYNFEENFNIFVEELIQTTLMKHLKHSSGYLKVWKEHRNELRFTELYLRGWFATIFIPLANHQAKVDKNDKSDAEQLSFLEWADIFVSDDTRFQKVAFNLLFPMGDKQFMTSSEFLNQIEIAQ